MRFLLLLLPNVYDIFTALAIGYAYFVDKETPLKIPFLFACIVIYVATRLGIFAGQIIGMMSGQVNEEPADVNDADAFAKRLIWGFVPQLIGVIIFQVIMAFCYLPTFPGMPKPQQAPQVQQTQSLFNDKNVAPAASQQPVQAEEPKVAETKPEQKAVYSPVAENKPVQEPKPAVNKVVQSNAAKKITVTPKKAEKVENKPVIAMNSEPQNTVRYAIPERTLSIAGVSQDEVNLNSVNQNTVQNQPSNSGSWSFSAGVPSATQNAAKTVSSVSGSDTQPKRYPGDDNPINTSWGYYRTGKWAADAAKTLNNK